jgi:transglutaminase-like putative cysteine protease
MSTGRIDVTRAIAAPPAPPVPRPGSSAPPPLRAPAPAERRPEPATTRALLVRLVAAVALALFGAQAWAGMVRPEAPGPLLAAAALGGLVGLGALACHRIRRPARAAALSALVATAGLAALLLAGVPLRLLDPEFWGELGAGLGQGIAALPGLSVPYRGVDEWNRIAMLLGGTLLAVAGPLVACWPGRAGRVAPPGIPAVVLAVLYAVPAVQLSLDHPFLEGAIFALLLAAVLFAERLGRRELPVAAAVVVAAALAGLVLAPRLDASEPWVDYESIAQSLGERGTSSFSWDHRYGPLDWPRDGREVLRIRARRAAYWKATTLADFDGLRWTEVRPQGLEDDPEAETAAPEWVEELRVSVRNLRTRQFVSAGTTLSISRSPRAVVPGGPGSFATAGRPLRRGHGYLARAYVPRPKAAQLDDAGTDFPTTIWPYLSMRLPERVGGPPRVNGATGARDPRGDDAFVVFGTFGDERDALAYQGRGFGDRSGTRFIEGSTYARTYRLARRLADGATSPYDFVRRVQAHFRTGYGYTETPPVRPVPLDAFLFDDKVGYCQQFSGAMALMLRMGGVPARVASGFSPGTRDDARGEYVVRDFDAHSWVEAYFPGYGWMTFDPTPSVAPARAQAPGVDTPAEEAVDDEESASAANASERGSDPAGIDAGAAETEGSGAPVGWIAFASVVALLTLAGALLVCRARRRRAAEGIEGAVAELERALRRSGRLPASGLTLARLEERLRGAPDAAAYVSTLRAARFGYAGDMPTSAQRRALRRELAAGPGLRGRARALWALPPW